MKRIRLLNLFYMDARKPFLEMLDKMYVPVCIYVILLNCSVSIKSLYFFFNRNAAFSDGENKNFSERLKLGVFERKGTIKFTCLT